jgi:hypothetical protein
VRARGSGFNMPPRSFTEMMNLSLKMYARLLPRCALPSVLSSRPWPP